MAEDPKREARWKAALPWAALAVPSVLYRLPPLANADGTNADAAICGLQAMHMLRGELSFFLHGSGYQTSFDSAVAALFYLFTGPSALALMVSTLVGHFVLTGLAFSILRRHLPTWTAVVATLPLVFTPGPLHTYVLYPPRQASLTIAMAAFYAVEVSKGSRLRIALGGVVGGLACFADPYAMIFLPVLALHALLCARDGEAPPDRATWAKRFAAFGAGGAIGYAPFWLLSHSAGASRGPMTLTAEVVERNAKRLVEDGLPCLLGTKVYFEKHGSDWGPWTPPAGVHALQLVGASIFVAAIALGAAAFVMTKRMPWGVRRLGLVGAAMAPVTIGGFLVSPMVMDFFSTRYLAALTLLSPLALAPLAHLLGPRRALLPALAPYLATAAIAGWVHYGSDVDGLRIVHRDAMRADEAKLAATLHEKGIRYAVADYWVTYRLSLLYREDPAFVPKNPAEDRYKPHREAFYGSRRVAYVHDARRSREPKGDVEARVRRDETGFLPDCERLEAGEFTILLLERKAGADPRKSEL